jgi:hypothetical protein
MKYNSFMDYGDDEVGDEGWLETAENNRQMCSICGRTIPKDVQRISLSYRSRYGTGYKRICGLCILTYSRKVNKKPLKKWMDKLIVDEL